MADRSHVVRARASMIAFLFGLLGLVPTRAEAREQTNASSGCRVEAVEYKGWHAQQISNKWVQLIFIPQNGGRMIQFTFAGHPFLFVNPKYEGKYFSPAQGQWFNYGGDKLWPLPEGNDDEQHWAGGSDILDDGPFSFRKVSEGQQCEIELTGPADPQTGIQYVRTIRLDADLPRVQFRATMKNMSGHPVEWSMQSVSQYDASDGRAQQRPNPSFWTYTPANPFSSYLNRYHVRFGPSENPAATVRDDGLFTVHYAHMAAELWLDSTAGWLAVVDGSTRYAMVERFQYQEDRPYPGKASVIFWTNGPELHLNDNREATMSGGQEGEPPYYLEAELNSPLCRLRAGESCEMQTEWFPTRAGGEFHGISDAGILIQPLSANRTDNGKIKLSGSFGVFFSGRLVARLYNQHGGSLGMAAVGEVIPNDPVSLDTEIAADEKTTRLSVHLVDANGLDRGALGEVLVGTREIR